MFGAERFLPDGLYVPLDDGNVASFCTDIYTRQPGVLSQSIQVELAVSVEKIYVEASCLVRAVDCVQFFDDIVFALLIAIICCEGSDLE